MILIRSYKQEAPLTRGLGSDIKSLLNDDEFRAVLNSLNVLIHDVKLDDRYFHTIIGINKEDLKTVFDKLNAS